MNTENWKWFRYVEIFEIKKGSRLTTSDMEIGKTRYIGAIDSNNGVSNYIANNEHIHSGNTISVSYNGSVGYAYYQEKPFWATDDVNVLYPRFSLNNYIALFLCTIIEREQYRYNYGRKWTKELMERSLIKLPSTTDGQPDWQWMEDYAKNTLLPQLPMKTRQVWEKRYNNQPLSSKKLELKVEEWKWFKIGDLFQEIYKAKAHVKQEVNITNDTSRGIIFVSRTETNNGCDVFVERDDGMVVEEGNAIIIGDTTATCFYQEKEFTTGDHIIVCRSNWLNKNTALFFKTIMDNEKYRFNYGRAFKMELVKEHKIKLPASTNENGEIVPDWQWMENYIKGLPYSGAL